MPNSIIVPLVGCKLKDDLIIDEANLTIKQKLHVIDNDNIKFVTMQNIKYMDGSDPVCEPNDVDLHSVPMTNPLESDIKLAEIIITVTNTNDNAFAYDLKNVVYNNITNNDSDISVDGVEIGIDTRLNDIDFRNKTIKHMIGIILKSANKYVPTIKLHINDKLAAVQKSYYRSYAESSIDIAKQMMFYMNFDLKYADNWKDEYSKDLKLTFYETNDEPTWNTVGWDIGWSGSVSDLIFKLEFNNEVFTAGPGVDSASGGSGELYRFVDPVTTDLVYTIDKKDYPEFTGYYLLMIVGRYNALVSGSNKLTYVLIKPIEDGTKLKYIIPNKLMNIYKNAIIMRGGTTLLDLERKDTDFLDEPTSK